MALKVMRFGLAKRVNPISAPQVSDCSYLVSAEPSPTLDIPSLGGGLARFKRIAPSRAMDFERIYLLERPESFSFQGLVISQAQSELLHIPALEIPLRDLIALMPEADVLADNLLINALETINSVLDDGIALLEPDILSEDSLLSLPKVESHTLDDGMVIPFFQIIDVYDYWLVSYDIIIVSNALDGDAFSHPSEVLDNGLDDGLVFSTVETVDVLESGLLIDRPTVMKFVNFLEVPEIISPFKLMPRATPVGKDYRSRYASEEGMRNGTQPQLPGLEPKCRHGNVRSKCQTCQKTTTKPRSGG